MKKRKVNFWEITILILILLIGLILRIYHLGDFANFFHDQGRDALVVKRIIVDHKFTLLGPQTTAKGVYLGPFYYYLMIIPLWLSKLNPVGMDYLVATLGTGAVIILFLVLKELTDKRSAFLASVIYATSPTIIAFSNHAWNPNPLPFFILLTIYGLIQVFEKRKEKYWFLIALGLGGAIQLHLFAIILFPLVLFSWLIKKYKIINRKLFFGSCLLFIIFIFPWFFFELRHDFLNCKNLMTFFFNKQNLGFSGANIFLRIKETVYWLLSLVTSNNRWLVALFLTIILLFLIRERKKYYIQLFGLWFLLGMITLGIYKGIFQLYHALFLTPLPFLFYGLLLGQLKKQELKIISLILTILLFYFNLKSFDFKKRKSRWPTLGKVAEVIISDVNNKKFNLAGLTWRFDHNAMDYRYFVELKGKKALEPDNYREAEVLYVVNEGQKENLLTSKIMEIADFKPKLVVARWKIEDGIDVYKLIK